MLRSPYLVLARARRASPAAACLVGAACALPLASLLTLAACATGPAEVVVSGGDAGVGGEGAGGSGPEDLFDGGTKELVIEPAEAVLDVDFGKPGPTISFKALYGSGKSPVEAKWSLGSAEAGTIKNGTFTANAKAGGEIDVRAEYYGSKAKAKLLVTLRIVENEDAVTKDEKEALLGEASKSDSKWNIVYPYDGTVFPRGILAPEVQFSTTGLEAQKYHVAISGKGVEYSGFFDGGTSFQLSQSTWNAIGLSVAGGAFDVRVAKLVNGKKYGPVEQTWRIAKGRLHGTIYYNTYDSELAGKTGAMMRIKGDSKEPEVLAAGCTVCHSVSSDGSTAAAANYSGGGGVLDLAGEKVPPPVIWEEKKLAAFAALYPIGGEVLVTNAAPDGDSPPNMLTLEGTWSSELRKRNGEVVPNSGIEGIFAQSPAFSHDGTMLAFTDRTPTPPYPSVLALMRYDAKARKFSDYQVLATPPEGRHYSWPAFTPDNRFIVFQGGKGDDLGTIGYNEGKLYAINVETKVVTELERLNGDGYMPAGDRDENLNFEPTLAPVASGGYFWVMFTSRRTYGNKLTGDRTTTKRLWVAAIDANAEDGKDPSHPAFYIAGQEISSANSRGFWSLDPCKPNVEGCQSGDECCGGFCIPSPDDGKLVCASSSTQCSAEFDACETASDCCDDLVCIGGKCSQKQPPK